MVFQQPLGESDTYLFSLMSANEYTAFISACITDSNAKSMVNVFLLTVVTFFFSHCFTYAVLDDSPPPLSSKVQARVAFSSYLQRVQQRLLAESRANAIPAWPDKDNDQMV